MCSTSRRYELKDDKRKYLQKNTPEKRREERKETEKEKEEEKQERKK